eukprot:NODE_6_length_48303_cov_0.387022.p1 type:complete len:1732 gc:universal NODE_6_length_48303_cov_0.387022:3792-8987(+)
MQDDNVNSGKARSIVGKINMTEMGSRAQVLTSHPKSQSVRLPQPTGNILDNCILQYNPKTDIQHQYYSHLLQYLLQKLGDLPSNDLHELAYNFINSFDTTYKEIFNDDLKHYESIKQIIHYLHDAPVDVPEEMNVDVLLDNENDNNQIIAEPVSDEEDHSDIDIQDYVDHLNSLLSNFSREVQESTFELINRCSDNPMMLEKELMQLFEFEHTDIVMFILENQLMLLRQLNSNKNETDDKLEPTQIIAFDDYKFKDRGHFQANKNCKLPQGSFKRQRQGYEEIHIPLFSNDKKNEPLMPISDLPEWCQICFKGVQHLNLIQSLTFKSSFNSNDNMLVSAPTGAGKTNISLLAMLRLIGSFRSNNNISKEDFKIIYVAPLKALVQELVFNFTQKLAPLGLVVSELTGDVNMTRQEMMNSNLIITTPEKWDVITRKGMDASTINTVKLLIVDEIHLLHDSRGPVLESIIVRSFNHPIRIIGLSATLPNYKDVGAFLKCPSSNVYYFDHSYRPCPLSQEFIGITERRFKRLELINNILYEKVMEDAGKYQVIIFVHSRKDTLKTAQLLLEMFISNNTLGKLFSNIQGSINVLQSISDQCENKKLKSIIPHGFGIHHAGLSRNDRTLIEDLFADGHLQVLVATSTLAVGINLPSHTCIIKGTKVYNPSLGEYEEIGLSSVIQMIGRAGRPGYDVFGRGVIITEYHELPYYLSILNSQFPIESQLFLQIENVLNAEIVLGNIMNINDACEYIKQTYLYTRMTTDPATYKQSKNIDDILLFIINVAHSAFKLLHDNKMIIYSYPNCYSTELGLIASYYYISMSNMSVYYNQIKSHFNIPQLLQVFANSGEFKYIPVRKEEELELKRLSGIVPIPVPTDSNSSNSNKIIILLQCYISNHSLSGFAIQSDLTFIAQSATRLFKCMSEICLYFKWYSPFVSAMNLYKMTLNHSWDLFPLNQIHYLPNAAVNKLNNTSINRLLRLNVAQLKELTNDANIVYSALQSLPKYIVETKLLPLTTNWYKLFLTIQNDFKHDPSIHLPIEYINLIVTDSLGTKIITSSEISIKSNDTDSLITSMVFQLDYTPSILLLHCISNRWFNIQSPSIVQYNIRPSLSLDPMATVNDSEMQKLLSFHVAQPFSKILAVPLIYHYSIIDMLSELYSDLIIVMPVEMIGLVDRYKNSAAVKVYTVQEYLQGINTSCTDTKHLVAMHVQNLSADYEVLLMHASTLSSVTLLSTPNPNYRDYCSLLKSDPKYSLNSCNSTAINHLKRIKNYTHGLIVHEHPLELAKLLIGSNVHTDADFDSSINLCSSSIINKCINHNTLVMDPLMIRSDLLIIYNLIITTNTDDIYVVVHPHFTYALFVSFDHVVVDLPVFDAMLVNRMQHYSSNMTVIGNKQHVDKALLGYPVESRLHLNAASLLRTVNANDEISVDLLVQTLKGSFLAARLHRNMYYYCENVNVFISDLIDDLIRDMTELELIKDNKLTALGMIMNSYSLSFNDMDILVMNVNNGINRSDMLDIICNMDYSDVDYSSSKVKGLLNKHMNNIPCTADTLMILYHIENKIHGLISVANFKGLLSVMISAIELMQMITQQVNNSSAAIQQLPYYEKMRLDGISSVYDLMELEDDSRDLVLEELSDLEKSSVAYFVNHYPNIEVYITKKAADIEVSLESDDSTKINLSEYFEKYNRWWIIVGNGNEIMHVELVKILDNNTLVKIPIMSGKLYLMCDGYIGCDQVYDV